MKFEKSLLYPILPLLFSIRMLLLDVKSQSVSYLLYSDRQFCQYLFADVVKLTEMNPNQGWTYLKDRLWDRFLCTHIAPLPHWLHANNSGPCLSGLHSRTAPFALISSKNLPISLHALVATHFIMTASLLGPKILRLKANRPCAPLVRSDSNPMLLAASSRSSFSHLTQTQTHQALLVMRQNYWSKEVCWLRCAVPGQTNHAHWTTKEKCKVLIHLPNKLLYSTLGHL